jgi:osmotically-inducible protein OsmY
MFVRTRWTIAGIGIGVLGSSLARTGLPKPGPADASASRAARAVGTIDGAVRSMDQGVREVSASVRGQLDRGRASLEDRTLRQRVEAALLRDEALDAREIDVTVDEEGEVILRGEVATAAAKEQAVSLTRGLPGVARVEDHLAVTPKTRSFGAPASAGRGGSTAR